MKISFAVNNTIRNKCGESEFDNLTFNYKNRKGTLAELKLALGKGWATCSALLKDPKKGRNDANFLETELTIIEFDNSRVVLNSDGKELDEDGNVWIKGSGKAKAVEYSAAFTLDDAFADPFISANAALIYTSPSHQDDWHKFRVIFILPAPVTDADLAHSCTGYLQSRYPDCDGATKDRCRAWYGNTNAIFPLYEERRIQDAVFGEMFEFHGKRMEAIAEQERHRLEYQREFKCDDADLEKRVAMEALGFVHPRQPGTGTYNDSLAVLTAIKCIWNDISIAQRWSPTLGKGWNIERKWEGLSDDCSKYGVWTICGQAKKAGWRYPEWAREEMRGRGKSEVEIEVVSAKVEGQMYQALGEVPPDIELKEVETDSVKLSFEIAELKAELVHLPDRSPESIQKRKEIAAKDSQMKALDKKAKSLKKKSTVKGEFIGPIVEAELYSDTEWICYQDELYYWAGNHYRKSPDDAQIPRISSFCNVYSVRVKDDDGNFSELYPFRETRHIMEALKWVKCRYMIPQELINPPGFNCKNGVIQCSWNADHFNDYQFVPHDPAIHYYLTPPNIDYDPDADPTYYNQLMQCLDPEYRDIWERTIASALDLKNIRIIKGSRTVRALLLKGDGSNGKDTLKTLVQQLFGYGKVSSCSFADFKQYDEGNRFSLFALQNKSINWPSENVGAIAIENLQSLKSAITGDTVYFEAKGRNAIEGNPQTVFMFNINKSVDLMTQLTALESRWAILPFNKTYSDNPKGAHELQADPRFKEDDFFVREHVAPAFLNRLLLQLQNVAADGIDYSPTKHIMNEMQQDACHLMQFCADTGLGYTENGMVTVVEIWDKLLQWYKDNQYVTHDEQDIYARPVWVSAAKNDPLIKSSSHVARRFLELFPKAEKGEIPGTNRNTKTCILRIGFHIVNT